MAQACAYLCHLCLYDTGGFGEFSEFVHVCLDLTVAHQPVSHCLRVTLKDVYNANNANNAYTGLPCCCHRVQCAVSATKTANTDTAHFTL